MYVKRKAIQLAKQTLVISLPAKWVKLNNITKGDELDIQLYDHELIIRNSEPRAPRGKKADFSLAGLNERTVRWALSGMHKQGIDEMNLSFDHSAQLPIVNDITKNLFIGMALVRQGPKGCTIKSLATEDPKTFDQTLRRAFQVTLSMADSLYEAVKDKDITSIEGIRELEKTNNQLTNFCQRLLNSGIIKAPSKSHFLYTICWNLEKIADDYKYICDHLVNHPHQVPPDIVGQLHNTNTFFRSYYELFFGFSLDKLNSLAEQKDHMVSEGIRIIQESQHPENVVSIHLHNLVMKTLDFSTSMFAYHH